MIAHRRASRQRLVPEIDLAHGAVLADLGGRAFGEHLARGSCTTIQSASENTASMSCSTMTKVVRRSAESLRTSSSTAPRSTGRQPGRRLVEEAELRARWRSRCRAPAAAGRRARARRPQRAPVPARPISSRSARASAIASSSRSMTRSGIPARPRRARTGHENVLEHGQAREDIHDLKRARQSLANPVVNRRGA